MSVIKAAQEAARLAIEKVKLQSKPAVKSPWFDRNANVSSFGLRRKLHAFNFQGVKQEVKTEPGLKLEFSSQPPPNQEWWDLEISEITKLVQHPIPIQKQIPGNFSKSEEARLTPKELKKLRKLKRKEKVQEIQDKIRMGVLPPPPPKVRLANLARVLGAAATADPSKIEAETRAAATARLDAHLKRNEDRKLTEEERRLKNIKNLAVAEGEKISIKVFVVKDLEIVDNQRRFKITKNAQQLQLSGCGLKIPGRPLLVVVEGKQKSVSRFERLMLRRIKWKEGEEDDDLEEDEYKLEVENNENKINQENLEN
jgi:U4/U6 small nuclear ribonucleoprotein PRP3